MKGQYAKKFNQDKINETLDTKRISDTCICIRRVLRRQLIAPNSCTYQQSVSGTVKIQDDYFHLKTSLLVTTYHFTLNKTTQFIH